MRFAIALIFFLSFSARSGESNEASISIARSGCYGTCPQYTITLFPDGVYFWFGEMHVNMEGYIRGNIKPESFQKAKQALEEARYLEFKERYFIKEDGCKEVWSDNPGVTIRVQTASFVKVIQHYHGCRGFSREDELVHLEDLLDKILKTESLVGNR
jgi:hypothetical protein